MCATIRAAGLPEYTCNVVLLKELVAKLPSRWVAEYLSMLTRKSKWFEQVRPIQVGDLVVVVDSNLSRISWPKGLVIEAVRAKDGQVRQAVVQTTNGIYKRPATKLALIEIEKKMLTGAEKDK
uniref:DUF5641 domain-containing protein n=1 Tax=Anopheles epiroticus TaxID=199890 RepID=A0A182PWM1_9DIPT